MSAAFGGIFWVFIYPILSGERKAERRRLEIAQTDQATRKVTTKAQTSKVRREQVEETLKELDLRSKKMRSPSLSVRIEQAGLSWTKQAYYIGSAVLGVVTCLAIMIAGVNIMFAVTIGLAVGVCLPRWTLAFLKKRREKKFLLGFADAVDVITRGIRAGLPLLDSIKVIAADSPQPIRGEFKAIIDTQAIGMPLGDACLKLYERMPLAEANFFGIVVSIQQKSGGNLSEALGNLSKVLRDRKKMKAKINAMSQEAKASAGIIGALPPLVMLIVYITSPDYISLLWQNHVGHLMLGGCVLWMFVGIMVMKKMISFDF
jgi:tight adherence protein B